MSLGDIENGAWHQIGVHWNSTTQTLTYDVDGVLRVTLTGDLAADYFGGSQFAHYGFGAGTGGGTNLQQLRNVTINGVLDGGPADQAPVLTTPIDDAAATIGAPFTLTIAANTFTDPDIGDTLTLSARLANSTLLPAWLTFDPVTGQFSGTPGVGDAGIYNIEVRAIDTAGAAANDVFTLSVGGGGGGALPQFLVNGNSSFSSVTGVHTLTPNLAEQVGTVMSAVRVDLTQSFTLSFDAFLGSIDAGADGIGFILHNDARGSAAIGLGGGEAGLKGIANGLGIQFDTYNNFSANDIVADHTNFFDSDLTGTFETPAVALGNLEDGAFHSVVVRWNALTQTLSYDVDGVQRGSLIGDLATTYLGGSEFAYMGFGGGTGGATNLQQVKVTGFVGTLEGQGGINNAPDTLTVGGTQTVVENAIGGTVVATLAATDPDVGDTLTFSLAGNAGGLFALSGNTVVVANGAVLDFETAASHAITVVVTDQGGLTKSQSVTIAVTNVNEAAVFSAASVSTGSVTEDVAPFQIGGKLTVVDPDAAESGVVALAGVAGTYGTFNVDAAGNWSYLLNNASAAVQSLTAASQVTETFAVSSIDGTATRNVVVTVNGAAEGGPVDQPPVLTTPIADAAATVGTLFTLTLPANTFTDPDVGDTLTISARLVGGTLLPAWLTFDAVTGQFAGTPAAGDTGNYEIEVRAVDIAGAAATDVFTIGVGAGAGDPLPQFVVTGNASFSAVTGVHTLTPNLNNQVGTVMSAARVDLGGNFTLEFDAFLGSSDAGADGIGFILHNDARGSAAIGLGGGQLGLEGIANGLGIQFDTYNNFSANDISADHTNFFDSDLTGTFETPAVALGNLEDGAFHSVVVRWNAGTQTLSYDVDGVQRGSLVGDLATTYLGGSQFAYMGFGGGTGGATNLQQVRVTDFVGTLEGQGGSAPDAFRFDAAALTGGIRSISDFSVADDTIELMKTAFPQLQGDASDFLLASNFVIGALALTVSQHVVYSATTGALSYDADGNGTGAAVQFATLPPNLGMTSGDFHLF